ncbi:MAG: hypothetical protein DRG83_21730 [Deltaproteobacteria bacterium]|nr:MAG: hypothetical protein DRG83_21730 [Deltaproteobacteria bacterium]
MVLDSCSVKTNRRKLANSVNIDVRHRASYLITNETSAAVGSVYDLVVFETTKKDFVLKLSCTYTILFTSEEPITSDFMDIFVDINVEMTTWPYFREFVQNMVQRAGLPPLTLPLIGLRTYMPNCAHL